LVAILRYRAVNDAARRAFVFLPDGENEGPSLTFSQLDERARAIAVRLQSQSAPGDRALLLYPPGLEFMAAFFGCLYAGVIAVPSYPPKRNRPDTRLQAIAADAGARIVLTDMSVMAEFEKRLEHTPELKSLQWIATDAPGAPAAAAWREPAIKASDLAILQYTSGSTSMPNGVMVSHGNLIATLDDLDRGWDHTPESVMVTWLPIFHDMGLIYGALMPLFRGFLCVMLPPAAFLQGPSRWLRAITRYKGTHSAAPNFAYDLCVATTSPEQRSEFDLRSWHLSLNAAEPVRSETLVAFNEAFAPCGLSYLTVSPGYGLAEASLKVSALPRRDHTRLCHVVADELARHRVAIGSPGVSGVQAIVGCGQSQNDSQICIVDPETCKACDSGMVGEIWFAGPSVAQGYWGRAAETEACFRARLADSGQGPFLRTGDLGFVYGGELFITGRLKDLIIIRGLNHYPQDIEQTVERCHPALRPACGSAFAIDAGGREVLVIAQEVERTHLRRLNVEEIVSAIRQSVSEKHDLPVHAVALLRPGSIPKTSSGKIRRRACRALFLDGQLEVVGEWSAAAKPSIEPVTAAAAITASAEHALEHAVIEAWLGVQISRRLKIPAASIDPREAFSRYGLDSLAAVELSGELERWLGRHLPPTLLYDFPSIRLLAAHLTAVACEPAPPDETPVDSTAGPIAIVGLGCRFPGADSPDAFWRLLSGGTDAIRDVPIARWQADDEPATRRGGFLDAVDGFDAEFFGISPREADLMDPQQRLLLEVGWEALEDAGIAADTLGGSRTGVFVGISGSDYSRLLASRSGDSDAYSSTGNALSIAANRLSYFFDLRGPSWAVDTACSSSLVAVHQACRSLRAGECTLALAGGVNLLLAPDLTAIFARAGMLASDGRCKTFDAAADGYVRGEGCGVVVLKRLADAHRDGDRILAVVRGTAVNQDGRSNGLTAPNGPAQQAVLRSALRDAHIVPNAVSYVEAHGTGTALGDPIEVNSLLEVLKPGRMASQPCWIGSVKTNFGHLEAAAGIAGLIKVVLALRHQKIPPHLHLQKLNPLIELGGTAFAVPQTLTEWPASDGSRYAGVSSFGFGGTNAHVVVSEAPPVLSAPTSTRQDGDVLVLSARTEPALRQLAARYGKILSRGDASPWFDVCRTAALGRSALPHRLAVFAAHGAEAAERLGAHARADASGGFRQGHVERRPRIAFLFSGQGSIWRGMGRDLYAKSPVYRSAFEECRSIVSKQAGWDLSEFISTDDRSASAEFGQVALFAVQFALGRLWSAWGVIPDAVGGHSVGEYAAACVAGVLTLDEALKLLLERARLMGELGNTGAMAAVQGTEDDVAGALVRFGVEIGAVNSARQVVLTGENAAIAAAGADLTASGFRVGLLDVKQAYHSRKMKPILDAFGVAAAGIHFRPPQCTFISSVTGGPVRDELTNPGYWVQQIRQPVRFGAAMEALKAERIDLFIEIGPRATLLALGQHGWPAGEGDWLPSLRPGGGDWAQMIESAGRAWVRGAPVDWRKIHTGFFRSSGRPAHLSFRTPASLVR
jgi:acyl transferase domain-containing protein/acyl-CoA synthetase (AMP-forming)/AMP-acid ligase II/acyl carrier protein